MADNSKALQIEAAPENSYEIFRRNWDLFRNIIKNNYMSHAEAYTKLHNVLITDMPRPFTFADLACGDAYSSSRSLLDTEAAKYVGIDLSETALDLAREEFGDSHIDADFVITDLLNFHGVVEPPVDVVWVGLSLHHLGFEDKAFFMRKVKEVLADGGLFLIYEPVYINGENRLQYCERFKNAVLAEWHTLERDEKQMIIDHVYESEIPETPETWIKLAKDAGFESARQLFTDRYKLWSLFKFK